MRRNLQLDAFINHIRIPIVIVTEYQLKDNTIKSRIQHNES